MNSLSRVSFCRRQGDMNKDSNDRPHLSCTGVIIRSMRNTEAPFLASLHKKGLPPGFLSQLGPRFLAYLYKSIAASHYGIVLVAVEPSGRIIGFVSGATDIGKIYRQIALRRGWLMIWLLLRFVFSVSMCRRILETILYPCRVEREHPKAELLSIVVDPCLHGSGVAGKLVRGLVQEFERRGCMAFKVLVNAQLDRANAFYRKEGFRLVDQVQSHGSPSNIYLFSIPSVPCTG